MGDERTLVNNSCYDYHVIRYAEVLLILAKLHLNAMAQLGDGMLDKTINVIRAELVSTCPNYQMHSYAKMV